MSIEPPLPPLGLRRADPARGVEAEQVALVLLQPRRDDRLRHLLHHRPPPRFREPADGQLDAVGVHGGRFQLGAEGGQKRTAERTQANP